MCLLGLRSTPSKRVVHTLHPHCLQGVAVTCLVRQWVPSTRGANPSPGTRSLEDNLFALFQTLAVANLSTGQTLPTGCLGANIVPLPLTGVPAAAVPCRCSPKGHGTFCSPRNNLWPTSPISQREGSVGLPAHPSPGGKGGLTILSCLQQTWLDTPKSSWEGQKGIHSIKA